MTADPPRMKALPAPPTSPSEIVERTRERLRERLTGEDGAPPQTWAELKRILGDAHPALVR